MAFELKRIDITQTLETGMRRYASIEDFEFRWLRQYDIGDGMALSRFKMASHLGTHIDAPLHFFAGGGSVDTIPLETLCGPAQVVDATGRPCVDQAFVESLDIHHSRLLFLTDNTRLLREGGQFENVYFTPNACALMADRGVLLIGTDYFSVDRCGDKSHSSHLAILSHQIVILEAIILDGVLPGDYTLYCLPLKLKGLEGAPCRAILETSMEETN